MQIIQAPRASTILYYLLTSQAGSRPWLLPANICPIVPITFFKAHVPFEFIDISAETLHMDLDQAETLISKRRYGGILYAHTYGEVSTPNELFRRIKELDESIMIVDDRCLCVPDLQPNAASNVADVQLYSTGYAKIANLGFGGYAFLRGGVFYHATPLPFNPYAHERIERDYKKAIKTRTAFEYQECDWLQTEAVLTSWQEYSRRIEQELEISRRHRKRLNAIYESHLPRAIQLPDGYQLWRFNICVNNKTQIMEAIFTAGLFASSHYVSLAGIMSDGKCPQAERFHDCVINLFNDHFFNEEQAQKACEVILGHIS